MNLELFDVGAAVIRAIDAAALALVATDPTGALRLALLASELRQGGTK